MNDQGGGGGFAKKGDDDEDGARRDATRGRCSRSHAGHSPVPGAAARSAAAPPPRAARGWHTPAAARDAGGGRRPIAALAVAHGLQALGLRPSPRGAHARTARLASRAHARVNAYRGATLARARSAAARRSLTRCVFARARAVSRALCPPAVEVSPFWGIEKAAVLQDARCFNDSQLDARRCQQARRLRSR
jgi:hypothetical protein